MFVSRNADGEILTVSKVYTDRTSEELPDESPELALFFGAASEPQRELLPLQASDLDTIRVLEDLIDLLIVKGAIAFTDFPEAAQRKLRRRQALRKTVRDLNLLDDDDETI